MTYTFEPIKKQTDTFINLVLSGARSSQITQSILSPAYVRIAVFLKSVEKITVLNMQISVFQLIVFSEKQVSGTFPEYSALADKIIICFYIILI